MQINFFDIYNKYKIKKPIRLIEFFAGFVSQNLSLKYLGVKYESYKICEWAVKSIQAYKDLHFAEDNTDYSKGLTKEELIDYLYNKGISSNYNEPMTKNQIKRFGEDKLRTIYNNIKATHNLVNIQQVKGDDLEITNTDKYEYILTYSFPCQDLSMAGKMKGMSDTSSRSGMLWEVERILKECMSNGGLPSILLMENVPAIHNKRNIKDFEKWQEFLKSLGYFNFWQDLIATDYGIPQARNRTFMVSILGNYNYTFPPKTELKLKLKDLLEENVDEKYFLSDKMIDYIFSKNDKYKVSKSSLKLNREIACSKTTREGNTRADTSDYIAPNERDNYNLKENIAKSKNNIDIALKNNTKQLRETIENNEINEFDSLDLYNRTKHENISQCLDTGYHNSQRVVVKEETLLDTRCDCSGVVVNQATPLQKEVCNKAVEKELVKPYDIIDYTYSNARLEEIKNGKIKTKNGKDNQISNTITTNAGNFGVCVSNLRIRKLTPKECFRLMGVKDEDFEKIAKNQSNSSLYHLAGDSIVVDVLCAIFKQLL